MADFENDIVHCLRVLESGGLILYPTDTVWGIGCDATNESAVSKIYELKQRPPSTALIVLVAEERDVLRYVAAVDLSLFDYLQQTTKPTTVVYNGAVGLANNLLAPDGSVGIRICTERFCRTLLKRFRKPIVSTSANISGDPTPSGFHTIDPVITAGVDHVVKYRQDDENKAEPSAVIRWEKGSAVVLRP